VDPKAHWEHVYQDKAPDEVSWFEPRATLSLDLIRRIAPDRDSAIIDVGAGASTLVDGLLDAGYHNITVLDLSGAALAQTRKRLAGDADLIEWLEADVLSVKLPPASFDVWHDRATFHFLTTPEARERYVAQVRHAVRPGGHVLVATFAEDGPSRCSGLPVERYSPEGLQHEFGDDFHVVTSQHYEHRTPAGARQAFTYCLCRFEPHAATRHAA
jgi:SAM-dependent methyltransferase